METDGSRQLQDALDHMGPARLRAFFMAVHAEYHSSAAEMVCCAFLKGRPMVEVFSAFDHCPPGRLLIHLRTIPSGPRGFKVAFGFYGAVLREIGRWYVVFNKQGQLEFLRPLVVWDLPKELDVKDAVTRKAEAKAPKVIEQPSSLRSTLSLRSPHRAAPMSDNLRQLVDREKFLSLQAANGATELYGFLKAMNLTEAHLVKAGLIKSAPINTATNYKWRTTLKGKQYFTFHVEYEAILLLPGMGAALMRALDKVAVEHGR